MENSIVTKNINLERFERVKKISKYYVEYEIGYSVSDQIEIKAEIKGKYDYVLISHVDDIVTSYQGVVRDFYNKSKSGIVCKIKDIPDLLEIYKEDYFSLEIGEFV